MNYTIIIMLTLALLGGIGYHLYQRSQNILHEVIQSYWIWTQLITIGLLAWISFNYAQNFWHYLLAGVAALYFLTGPLSRGISNKHFSVFRGTLSVMIPIPFNKVDKVVLTKDENKNRINLLSKANNQYFIQSYRLEQEDQLTAILKEAGIQVEVKEPQA